MKHYLKLVFWVLFIPLTLPTFSQTCCSGGVPISNEVGLPQGQKGSLLVTFNYDYNSLKRLISDGETIDNPFRSRAANTLIAQTSYAVSDGFGVDLLLPYIWQERNIISIGGTNTAGVQTNGFGDPVLLGKYNFTLNEEKNSTLLVSAGVKFPLGADDLQESNGRFITADLQPGSGSFDFLTLARWSSSIGKDPSLKVLANASYVFKTENEDYNLGDGYQFGNVVQLSTGISDQFVIGNNLADANVLFRYRNTARDQLRDSELINTGGEWVFVDPAVNYWVSDNVGMTLKANFPLYHGVYGEQLSSSFRVNGGVIMNFGKKDSKGLKK